MRTLLQSFKGLFSVTAFLFLSSAVVGQTLEWRLVNPTYNSTDPDGAGPATGSFSFKLQIHTVSGTVSNVNAISVGWSYQSANTMIPTVPGCNIVSNPANVTVGSEFLAGGFAYTTVNQCNNFTQTTGGQTFDKRAVGTMDGTDIDITTTWIDMFTVTLWTVGTTAPYVALNSGAGGSPGQFTTYAVSDDQANEYVVNSLTYSTPLAIGTVPVTYTNFTGECSNAGAVLYWSTATEVNNDRFEVERSRNGVEWNKVGTVRGNGTTVSSKDYKFIDAEGGNALYRIKQIDTDGRFEYSKVVSVNCSVAGGGVKVFPNPARNLVQIVLRSEQRSSVTIQLVDNLGRVILERNEDVFHGSNTLKIGLNNIPAGTYSLRVVDGKNSSVHKLSILGN